MKKWQIQTLLANGDWEDTCEPPVFYDTKEEAFFELYDFTMDCELAVEDGYLEDFNPKDWRVAEVEQP